MGPPGGYLGAQSAEDVRIAEYHLGADPFQVRGAGSTGRKICTPGALGFLLDCANGILGITP